MNRDLQGKNVKDIIQAKFKGDSQGIVSPGHTWHPFFLLRVLGLGLRAKYFLLLSLNSMAKGDLEFIWACSF